MTIPADISPEPSQSLTNRIEHQTRYAKFAAFAVLAMMFLPLPLGHVYVCDDLLNYHLPIRQFYSQCLERGDSFDWMPGLFSGFFLTGSGQAGTYHPLHWLLYRFLPLQTAFNLEILSSYPFMLWGMTLFLQRHLRRPDAAWLGAIVFTFSGFSMLHFLHPNAVAVVSHLPWLLLAHDVLLRPVPGSTRRRIAAEMGVAFLTASQLLLGYPQYVWFSLVAEAVYCLGFASLTGRGIRVLALLTLLKIMGLGLGAVQLLPSMDALAESDRSSMPAEYFFQDPLTAPDMLQWVNPFLTKSRVFGMNTHELGTWCGALPLLLAVICLIRIRTRTPERRLVQVMLVLGLVALWLSFGKAGGLYVVQTWLPLVGKFRWPSRIIVLMHFVVATLAAIGYVRLTSDSESSVSHMPRALLCGPVLSLLAALLVPLFWPPEQIAVRSLLVIGPILFTLAVLMIRDLSQGRVSPIFMLFVAGDLAAYGFTYEALSHTQTLASIVEELPVPPGSPSEGRIIAETHLIKTNIGFGGNELLLAGWMQADGYEGLLPKMHLLEENLNMDGLRISGVKWIVNSGLHASIPGLKPTSSDRWLEVPDPLPRVRLTNRTQTIVEADAAVKALSANGRVVVDRDVPGLPDTAHSGGIAELAEDRPGRIVVRVHCDSTQLLVLSERYSKAWTVLVDGLPARIVRADVDFMGCAVPSGEHSVQFLFAPVSVKNGIRISLGLTILMLVYGILRLIAVDRPRSV